jgi:hypothetical protein
MGWMQFKHIKQAKRFFVGYRFPPNSELWVSIQTRVAFHSVTSHIFGNGISLVSDVPV